MNPHFAFQKRARLTSAFVFLGLLLCVFIFSSSFAWAWPPEDTATSSVTSVPVESFDLIEERQRLLDLSQKPVFTQYVVENAEAATPQAKALVDFYVNTVQTYVRRMQIYMNEYTYLYILVERGLNLSEGEKVQWEARYLEAHARYVELQSSPEYKRMIYDFYRLSDGLSGELADTARQMHDNEIRFGVDPSQVQLYEEIEVLELKIQDAATNSPLLSIKEKTAEMTVEIRRKFLSGDITFVEASRQLLALQDSGAVALGQDIYIRAHEWMDRIAILRTEIAQQKGFANWAQFQFAITAKDYQAGWQTTQENVQILEDYLSKIKPFFLELSTVQLQNKGYDINELYEFQSDLLKSNVSTEVEKYLDRNSYESFFRETMLGFGFSEDALAQVTVDAFPRPGKVTSAYMMPGQVPTPVSISIDVANLETKISTEDANWSRADIHIISNLRSDNLWYLATTFHEGGHAVEYIHRRSFMGSSGDSSAAYAETFSFLMQGLLSEADVIRQAAQAAGKEIPESVLNDYIRENTVDSLFQAYRYAMTSLIDISLWDYAYKEGSESLSARMLSLHEDVSSRFGIFREVSSSLIPRAFKTFTTSHLYSGRVDYVGYFQAVLARDSIREKLLADLEAATGRRSLYGQPTLAQTLISNFYREGSAQPFPQAVENFVGAPLRPDQSIPAIEAAVKAFVAVKSCNQIFATQ